VRDGSTGSTISVGRLARFSLVVGIWFCYVVVLSLILYTNYCASCAGSQLWKYTILGSSLVWIAFFYVAFARMPRTVSHEFYSVFDRNLLALVMLAPVTAVLAPFLVTILWGEAYRIVYFGSISFDFFGPMVLVVTATAGMISLTIGLLVPRVDSVNLSIVLGKGNHWWGPALRRFSFLAWSVLLPTNFGDLDMHIKFSMLFMTTLIVPAIYPLVEKRPELQGFLSRYLGLGPLCIVTILNLIIRYPLVHPFMVIGFLSFLVGCLSSAVGDLGSYCLEIKHLGNREALLRLCAIAAFVLLFVAVTWFYSHLAIFV